MCYKATLVEQAQALRPHQWDEVQKLIDKSDDTREIETLERIMIDKFHEEESQNGDL